jgi:hypothetical protein
MIRNGSAWQDAGSTFSDSLHQEIHNPFVQIVSPEARVAVRG